MGLNFFIFKPHIKKKLILVRPKSRLKCDFCSIKAKKKLNFDENNRLNL
jgi:hypothetical protein